VGEVHRSVLREDFRFIYPDSLGFIPAQERANSDVRGLSLFLSDFVMDTGPLFKRDEDLLGVGGGNAGSGDGEEASESIALVQRRAVGE